LNSTFQLLPAGCLLVNSTTPSARSRDQNVPAWMAVGTSVAAATIRIGHPFMTVDRNTRIRTRALRQERNQAAEKCLAGPNDRAARSEPTPGRKMN